MRKKIRMTGDDTHGGGVGKKDWSMWWKHPIVVAQWIHPTSSFLKRMVRTPGGIEIHRTTRTPFVFGPEGEGRERERVGRSGKGAERKGTERSNREEREGEWGAGERAGEKGRERLGERPTEQESGANQRKGRVVGLS